MPSLRSSPDRKGRSGAWELLPRTRAGRAGEDVRMAQRRRQAPPGRVARPGAAVARAGLPSTTAPSAWPLQSH